MRQRENEAIVAGLAARLRSLQQAEQCKLGFPGWSVPLATELQPFFSYELNNYGDPDVDPVFPWHLKDLERELVEILADLFSAPVDDRWGYVTTGGSEGILYGLWLARTMWPAGVVYHSAAAHGSVAKNVDLLNRRSMVVATDERGEMDYGALRNALAANRAHPAIVVATIGTTLTEAVDDVSKIRQALRDVGIRSHYIHADAALSGIPLALATGLAPFGLHRDGVDSLSVSGHKFLGAPFPCGVLLTRGSHRRRVHQTASYTGSPDPTIGSSRSAHAALVMWHRLRTLGPAGLRDMAKHTRELAAYAEHQLTCIGWNAWRAQPYACTVVLETPPSGLLKRWPLATINGLSHLVCTPGVTRERIAHFVDDLQLATQSVTAASVVAA